MIANVRVSISARVVSLTVFVSIQLPVLFRRGAGHYQHLLNFALEGFGVLSHRLKQLSSLFFGKSFDGNGLRFLFGSRIGLGRWWLIWGRARPWLLFLLFLFALFVELLFLLAIGRLIFFGITFSGLGLFLFLQSQERQFEVVFGVQIGWVDS